MIAERVDFGNFFVSLDEFEDLNWTVFFRNLCRAIGLAVMVANTNTNLAGLTGHRKINNGRGLPDQVLGIVVHKLNGMTYQVFRQLFPGIEEKFNQIIEYLSSSPCSKDAFIFEQIVEDFRNNLQNILRPGLAGIFAETILKVDLSTGRHDALYFIDLVMKSLNLEIKSSKTRILSIFGILGTFGLMMSNE